MRFAASKNAMAAMGGYSQYQPDQIIGSSLAGRSQTRRAKTVGDMQISIAENEAEAMLEAAALRGAAEKSAANSRGNAALFGGIMQGVGSFAGPISKAMNRGGGITSYDQIPAEGLSGPDAGLPQTGGWGSNTDNAYFGTGGKYGTFKPGSYTDYNPAPWP